MVGVHEHRLAESTAAQADHMGLLLTAWEGELAVKDRSHAESQDELANIMESALQKANNKVSALQDKNIQLCNDATSMQQALEQSQREKTLVKDNSARTVQVGSS